MLLMHFFGQNHIFEYSWSIYCFEGLSISSVMYALDIFAFKFNLGNSNEKLDSVGRMVPLLDGKSENGGLVKRKISLF